jgi:hypothetical protein
MGDCVPISYTCQKITMLWNIFWQQLDESRLAHTLLAYARRIKEQLLAGAITRVAAEQSG